MRARAVVLATLGSIAVLAAGWQLGARPSAAPIAAPAGSPADTGAADAPAPTADSAPAGRSTAATGRTGTFVGAVEQTRYGPVQVEAVLVGGRLVDVKALQLTNDGGRSVAISADAAPRLRTEALQAQSAKVDVVSGATYTSDGYRTSLQAALDDAAR